MIAFQVLGILLLAALVAFTVATAARRHLSWTAATGWSLLWIAAAVAIALPGSTMIAADLLGIDRGADLVFYCAILAMSTGFFLAFVRFRRLEHELTRVVRHLAIREAVEPEEQRGDPARGPRER